MTEEIVYEEVPIYDNIHGFVKVTPLEKKIINSIYFQRLREIKQLSFAYYVFPGATHSRFSHSIGVLAITAKILDRINEVDKGIISSHDFLKLRIAALLHDIGHYPFSHMIESSYKEYIKYLKEVIGSEDDGTGSLNSERDKYISIFGHQTIYDAIEIGGHHEGLGAYIINKTDFDGGITRILKNHGFSAADIYDISRIIQGKSSTNWFNQILHSELDADRLDYLMRDCVSTGVEYGNFDFDYLVNNCRLVRENKTGRLIFSIKHSAVFTIEHFLLARYFWYSQIIYDRAISIFNKMGELVFYLLLKYDEVFNNFNLLQVISNPHEFFKFNDKYLWDKLYWIIESEDAKLLPEYEFLYQVSNMLIERIPLKRMDIDLKKHLFFKDILCDNISNCTDTCHKAKGCPKNNKDIDALQNEFYKKFESIAKKLEDSGKNPLWVIPTFNFVSISKLYSMPKEKDNAERDRIRIYKKNGDIEELDKQLHSIIPTLSENDLLIQRIYIKEEYEKLFNK